MKEKKTRVTRIIPILCGLLCAVLWTNCGDSPTGKEDRPKLTVAPDTLDFEDSTSTLPLTIGNADGGELTWQAGSPQEWISITPESGTVNEEEATVQVAVDRGQLSTGEHAGSVEITSSGGDASIPVTATGGAPVIAVSTREADFGAELSTLPLEIANAGTGTLTWQFDHSVDWLTVEPARGKTGQTATSVQLSAQRRTLVAGSYTGKVLLFSNSTVEPVVELTMTLQIEAGPVMDVTPDSLDLGRTQNELTLELDNAGNLALEWTVSKKPDWLTATPERGTVDPGESLEVVFTVERTGLAPGEHTGELVIQSNTSRGDRILPARAVVPDPLAGPERELTVVLSGADFFIDDVELDFVWIEPGTFAMGSPADESARSADESPVRQVTISRGFYLGKYEITQEQWESVMETKPWLGQGYTQSGPRYPAISLSWGDVKDFIDKLNEVADEKLYRLPTEAEWEYACRAGTSTPWSFGDEVDQLDAYAWHAANTLSAGTSYAHPIGNKQPNPWGLHDMHGNVWEWCADWYGPYDPDSQTDPTGPTYTSLRVMRGGGFSSLPSELRSANRDSSPPEDVYISVGARLVRVR